MSAPGRGASPRPGPGRRQTDPRTITPARTAAAAPRPASQLDRPPEQAQRGGHSSAGPPCGVDIALDLVEGDGSPSQRPALVENGVVGVLPPLVQQAIARLPLVLDEAVPVPVAVAVDPAQGRLDVGPERLH